MQNSKCKIMVCLRHRFILSAEPTPLFCILHSAFCISPAYGEGKKIIPSPDETGVGYKVFHGSTLVALRAEPLIDALTGAPDRAFLPGGSEVVSHCAVLQMPCTKVAPSLGILRNVHVFVTAFNTQNLAQKSPAVKARRGNEELFGFLPELGGKRGNPTKALGYIIAVEAAFLGTLERKGGIAITKEKIFLRRWLAVLSLVMVAGLVMHHKQTARPVTYTVMGENAVWIHTTAAQSPGQVLEELGLSGNWYAEDQQIYILREQKEIEQPILRQEQYTAILPIQELRYGDPNLPAGEERILRPGQSQQILCAAQVTYLGGAEISRRVESWQLLQSGEDRIVAVGTGQWVPEPEKSTLPVIGNGIIRLPTGEVLTYSEEIRSLATAYCDKGKTATGTQARVGAIAVDPDYIPYGTRMFIMTLDGEYVYGIATAEDCGSKKYIHDTRIDLHFNTYAECRKFGARWCRVFFLT